MSISGIRLAIKTALENIEGLHVFDVAPEDVNQLPAAYILPRGGDFDTTFGGSIAHRFEIIVLVARGTDIGAAQKRLDQYLEDGDPHSVKTAVDVANLGAHGDTIRITGYRDYSAMEYSGAPCLGVKFDCEVVT